MRILWCFLLLGVGLPLWAAPGAWPVEHEWQEEMAPGKTYVDGYFEYAKKRARELYEQRVRLDCADLAITILVEYAYKHKLEVSFWFPAERKWVRSTDERFSKKGFAGFLRWAKAFVGAQNLADNTYAVPLEQSMPGDVVLFDWNQTPAWPDFPGREVWHTYLIGEKGAKVIYYGNLDDGQPLEVRMGDQSTYERVRSHPDRYGSGARRWKLFRRKHRPHSRPTTETQPEREDEREEGTQPEVEEKEGVVKVRTRLNIRSGPGTNHRILGKLRNGDKVKIIGKKGKWYKIRLANGKIGWVHSGYVKIKGIVGSLERLGE